MNQADEPEDEKACQSVLCIIFLERDSKAIESHADESKGREDEACLLPHVLLVSMHVMHSLFMRLFGEGT